MTPAITVELNWRGIFSPQGAQTHRMACPHCPPPAPRYSLDGNMRTGGTEKPLRLRIISNTEAELKCFVCETSERITA